MLVATVLTGCFGDEQVIVDIGELAVTSAAFEASEPIPVEHTCDGEDVPPPLTWSPVPEDTREIVVFVSDADADGFAHWAVAGIDPGATAVPEGAVEGRNDFDEVGYSGPCPPEGDEPHEYVFNVYALSKGSGLDEGFGADEMQDALNDAIAAGDVRGTYARQ